MKKRFIPMLLAAGFLLSQSIQAQIRLGVKAGINSAMIHIPNLESGVVVKQRVDFQGGFMLDIPMTRAFSLQPALLISTKGSNVTAPVIDGNTGVQVNTIANSIKLVYAEIPVLAMFRARLSPSWRLYGGIGPYLGIGLGGRLTSTYFPLGEREAVFGSGNPGSNSFRRFDYGASAAAGVEINRLQLGLNYNYGLVDLGSATNKSYHRTLGITVGFWMGKSSL